MRQMLLSIKPEFVERILNGEKLYEFRKVRCKSDVNKIIIYATAPIKMVVAEADIEYIIEDDLLSVWHETKQYSGISYSFFRSYFKGKKRAVAYKLQNVTPYKEQKTLLDYGLTFAPQSFVYIKSMQ